MPPAKFHKYMQELSALLKHDKRKQNKRYNRRARIKRHHHPSQKAPAQREQDRRYHQQYYQKHKAHLRRLNRQESKQRNRQTQYAYNRHAHKRRLARQRAERQHQQLWWKRHPAYKRHEEAKLDSVLKRKEMH